MQGFNRPYHTAGSTGVLTAYPARKACLPEAACIPEVCDGGPGGAPRWLSYAPLLPKPAVLARLKPDPSHGTPGTAISAITPCPGAAPSRQRRRGGGKAFVDKLEQALTQLNRKYLAMLVMALAYALVVYFLRFVIRIILIDRQKLSRVPALPSEVSNRVVHDRREALFRRRAVFAYFEKALLGGSPFRFGQSVLKGSKL